ncbi:MAG: DUF2029 domain-containing protein [Anaerolineales bacterium]|nr:MAG: DUF2029 domain-containing protein [Anaerolineales bacterium]
MLDRLRDKSNAHQDFMLLLLLYTSFRLMTRLLYRPGGLIYDYSDYYFFRAVAELSNLGHYPFIHYWMEYPPLFPWLNTGVYRLSLLIPLWIEPRLWFYTLLSLATLPFEIGNLTVLYLIALELYDRAKALRCAWIYACLFTPIYTWTGWFDNIPLFFLLLTLYFLLRQRGRLAGLATGLGFMVKVTPALLLPLGLRSLSSLSKKIGYLALAGLTVALISLPFLLVRPAFFLASFRSVLERSSWETIWALMDGHFSYGVLPADRFDPTVDFATHSSHLPWLWITVAFGLIYLWLYTRRVDWQDQRIITAFAGLSVNLFFLYSKGYSPQMAVTFIPFIVLLLPNLRGGIYLLLLTATNFLASAAYFIIFPEERWLLVGTVLSRSALILALAIEYGLIFFSLHSPQLERIKRRAFWALVALLLLAGCAAVHPLSKAYVESRYAQEEYRPVIELVRTEAEKGTTCLVLTDKSLYPRLYPWLRKYVDLHLVEDEKQITEVATMCNELWLFRRGEVPSAIKEWLEEHTHLVRDYDFDQGQLLRYTVR